MTIQESTVEAEVVRTHPAPPPFEGEARGFSLRAIVFKGATWTFLGFAASYVLKLSSSLILSRLLTPEVFGVAGLVWLYLTALVMFSDLGIGANVVRSNRGYDAAFLDTAWTLQVARGFLIWAVSLLLGWPMAWFYDRPELRSLIAVASLSSFCLGLHSTAMYTCTRRFAVWRLVVLDLIYQVVTLLLTAAIAWEYPSPWALVIGSVLGTGLRALLSHLVLGGHRQRFRWEPESVHELFTFGRWAFLSSLVTFLAAQSDRLVLGKLIDITEFGLYSIALTVAMAPRELFERLSNQLALPLLVRIVREPGGVRKATWVRVVMMACSALICATVIAVARPGIELVFPPRYHGLATFLVVLTFGSWLATVSSTYFALLISSEHPSPNRYVSLGVALRAVIFFTLVWPAFSQFGAVGVAALASLSEIGVILGNVVGVRKLGFPTLRVDLAMHLIFLLTTAALTLLCLGVRDFTGSRLAGVSAVALVSGSVALAGALALKRRPLAVLGASN
ncbi:MAG: oligosaccharide flippase family protein [Isosphaeraceae bacterium]